MSAERAPRITNSRDLGRRGRGVDIALGVAAILPIVALGFIAVMANPGIVPIVREAAAIWTGCLLAFLSGVRRGLSFSEQAGARPTEITSFLGVFVIALLTLVFRSPGLGGLGLVIVAALDWAAANRGQAPRYFRLLRPPQMVVGGLALLVVAVRAGL